MRNFLFSFFAFAIFGISCQQKTVNAESISHLEYLGVKSKAKEMTVNFFSDELDNDIYIPKEKISVTDFNVINNLFVYPNMSFQTVNYDFVVDGRILKHLLISYLGSGSEFKYSFNREGNITSINTLNEDYGDSRRVISYDKNGNISRILETDKDVSLVEENFTYNEDNLLQTYSKKIYDQGKLLTNSIKSYSYNLDDKSKIICTMNDSSRKTIFEITHPDKFTTSFANDDYAVVFRGVNLLSENKYKNKTVEKSVANTYDQGKIISTEIKNFDYNQIAFEYKDTFVSKVLTKDKNGQENFLLDYTFDNSKNWIKMTINNESAFKTYEKFQQKLKSIPSNSADELESMRNDISRKMIEIDIMALRMMLNRRRCERAIINY